MDKYERRRLNLIKIRDEMCEGKPSELANRLGRMQSYVCRMLYEEGKPGKRRIADDMIEAINVAFNLPPGWMDSDHSLATSNILEKLYAGLSPAHKKALDDMAKTLYLIDNPNDHFFRFNG